jgi:hypothetical protein
MKKVLSEAKEVTGPKLFPGGLLHEGLASWTVLP